MPTYKNENLTDRVIQLLKKGRIGVLPTDTLYGIHARAQDKKAVERVYKIRKRDPKKPFIILISDLTDLDLFEIKINDKTKQFLENIWPEKISVVLPCKNDKYQYLHRGKEALAFRMPKNADLLAIIKKTGPLISTTVNPEGKDPAKTIAEAKRYFGKRLAFYLNQGKLESKPSTLVKIENDKKTILRQGEVKVK